MKVQKEEIVLKKLVKLADVITDAHRALALAIYRAVEDGLSKNRIAAELHCSPSKVNYLYAAAEMTLKYKIPASIWKRLKWTKISLIAKKGKKRGWLYWKNRALKISVAQLKAELYDLPTGMIERRILLSKKQSELFDKACEKRGVRTFRNGGRRNMAWLLEEWSKQELAK